MRKFLFALTFVLSIFMATNTRADLEWDKVYAQAEQGDPISKVLVAGDKAFQNSSTQQGINERVETLKNGKHVVLDKIYTIEGLDKPTYVDQQKLTADVKKLIEGDSNSTDYHFARDTFLYYSNELSACDHRRGSQREGCDNNCYSQTCRYTAYAYLQEFSRQAFQAISKCNAGLAAGTKTASDCNYLSNRLSAQINDMKAHVKEGFWAGSTDDLCLFSSARVKTYDFRNELLSFYNNSGATEAGTFIGNKLDTFMSFLDGCWFCNIFAHIFDTVNGLATRLYSLLSEWFQALLAIMGFAAILFMVGKFFLTFHGTNIGQEYTNLFQMIGRMMLAFALLHASVGEVFGLFIRPFFSFTGALVDAINAVESPGAGGVVISLSDITINHTGNCSADQLQGIAQSSSSSPAVVESMCMSTVKNPRGVLWVGGKEAAFDNTMRATLMCMLKTTSAALLVGISQACCTMQLSFHEAFGAKWWIIPNVSMLLFGFIQFGAFLILYIMTPIKLLDVLIRFGFVAIMMPLWITFWVFKTTRGYTKKAWDIVMTSLFYLVTLTIMILLALKILGA